MAQSQVNLYNMALSAVGADYSLSTASYNVLPASLCNLWYENTRQVILRAAHWNSCKQAVRLTEEAERDLTADWVATDPLVGYAFSYEVPTDMLHARYLSTLEQFEIHYEAGDQKVINCNVGGSASTDAPILIYTIDVTDPTRWEPDLYQAMIYGLAGHICRPLTGKTALARDMFELANMILREAQARNANELHRMLKSRPDRLSARGYDYSTVTPYIYPYGNMFAGTGAPVV